MGIPRRDTRKTLSDLDRSRTYYMLDTTVCVDILNEKTDGQFGKFFAAIHKNKPRNSFLIPDVIKNELGRFVRYNTNEGKRSRRFKKYLDKYGKCESKYVYDKKPQLDTALTHLCNVYQGLSEQDAYLLYVFSEYEHKNLCLLTSDDLLFRAACVECPHRIVIDPRNTEKKRADNYNLEKQMPCSSQHDRLVKLCKLLSAKLGLRYVEYKLGDGHTKFFRYNFQIATEKDGGLNILTDEYIDPISLEQFTGNFGNEQIDMERLRKKFQDEIHECDIPLTECSCDYPGIRHDLKQDDIPLWEYITTWNSIPLEYLEKMVVICKQFGVRRETIHWDVMRTILARRTGNQDAQVRT